MDGEERAQEAGFPAAADFSAKHRRLLSVRRSACGQVLVFALIAMVIILVAVLFLFDVHTVIRGKVKGQSAVDAAALAGAAWQMHALNVIGELNLIKATTVLISDPQFGVSKNGRPAILAHFKEPAAYRDADGVFREELLLADIRRVEGERRKLITASEILTQMQTRVSFVLPLIGFGAAQQAAKNNGISENPDACENLRSMYRDIMNNSLYGNELLVPQTINGYAWRTPYAEMIRSILQPEGGEDTGIAVGTAENRLGTPVLSSNPPSHMTSCLTSRRFYEAVAADSWCELQDILGGNFTGAWWGTFECSYKNSFLGQSEILPLHVDFDQGNVPVDADAFRELFPKRFRSGGLTPLGDLYDNEEPYPYTYDETSDTITPHLFRNERGVVIVNPDDTDLNSNILPEFSWCVYDGRWSNYNEETVRDWERYLRSPFRAGCAYRSGAISWFEMSQRTNTLSGTLSGKNGSSDLGKAFPFKKQNVSSRITTAENRLRSVSPEIRADASAKPFGSISTSDGEKPPFAAGNLVLPVFSKTALLPVALEPPDGFSQLDRSWFLFLTEYIPLLGTSGSLDEQWSKVLQQYPRDAYRFSVYHQALKKLSDPDWRKRGLEWLNREIKVGEIEDPVTHKKTPVYKKNRDFCDRWFQGGAGGVRKGPGSLH